MASRRVDKGAELRAARAQMEQRAAERAAQATAPFGLKFAPPGSQAKAVLTLFVTEDLRIASYHAAPTGGGKNAQQTAAALSRAVFALAETAYAKAPPPPPRRRP